MKHARKDYDARIQDAGLVDAGLLPPGGTPIGLDEPVFLLRAHDRLAPHNLFDYAARAEDSGVDKVLVETVRAQAREMIVWQEKHGFKEPDLPQAKQPEVVAKAKK